jgi:hypothetical protein
MTDLNVFGQKLFTVVDGKLQSVRLSKKKTRWYGSFQVDTDVTTVHDTIIRSVQARITHYLASIARSRRSSERQQRLDIITNAVSTAVNKAVHGTDNLPSVIQTEGEKALGLYTRRVVETVRSIGVDRYEEIITRNMAQMMIFAREEVQGSSVLLNNALPAGTKFFYSHNGESAYIIEETPRVRAIIWDNSTVRLSFPYCIFVFRYKGDHYEGASFYFRNAPITNGTDKLFLAPLPDLSDKGSICWPGDMQYPQGGPAEVANTLQTVFWNSNFRSEHWGNRIGSPINRDQWVSITRDNPNDIVKQNWLSANKTVNHWYTDDPAGQISRLQQHVANLSKRIGTEIGAAVLQHLKPDDIAQERIRFQEVLRLAIRNAELPEKIEGEANTLFAQNIAKAALTDPLSEISALDRAIAQGLTADLEALQ